MGLFEERYPHVASWVTDGGRIEVGDEPMLRSFIRAIDEGGMVWEGAESYETLEAAFEDLERGLGAWMEGQGL